MSVNNAGGNAALSGFATVALYASLHTADPGTTGINEVTGGSPAYARRAVTWNTPASKVMTASNTPNFDVPAGTYTHIGYWTAITGGTFEGGQILNASATFTQQGTLAVTLEVDAA